MDVLDDLRRRNQKSVDTIPIKFIAVKENWYGVPEFEEPKGMVTCSYQLLSWRVDYKLTNLLRVEACHGFERNGGFYLE